MGSKLDITVLSGVSSGDVFHFDVDLSSSISVGRATECDIVLHDPMVSRRHLHIEHRSDGFFIVDEGSTHGTFHMGFHVQPGEEGARKLHSGDEFKIGDLLFRVTFDESEFRPKEERTSASKEQRASGAGQKSIHNFLRSKKGLALAVVGLCCLVVLLLPDEKKGLPPQRSAEVLSVPNFGVVGYLPGGPSVNRSQKDTTHLDKAQFDLPASDVLVEYSIISETKVAILLDDIPVEQLQPSPDSWQLHQLIVRGVALGKLRRVVFDNLSYPPGGQQKGPLKRWAVRDVRVVPLTSSAGLEPGFDSHLNAAIGLVEGIDKGPSGMFALLRGLQQAEVELMKELKIDAVGIRVDPGAEETFPVTNISELKSRLQLIQTGRQRAFSYTESSAYLQDLSKLISQIDAELWRRVNSHMNQAKLASKVKNYIEAHDQLISAMEMFPTAVDYRWNLLNRLYQDNKIVPKRVRQNPGNFRK
jgi:hypothetical protein